MNTFKEPTTIGLTSATQDKLRALKEDGYFNEMQDAYRFAVGLALKNGAIELGKPKFETIYNVGTLDPDNEIYEVVRALRDNADEPVYKTVERLAEWGVKEISAISEQTGDIKFSQWQGADDSA